MNAPLTVSGRRSARQRGFTLIELLTVLAILAIALTIGAPLGIESIRQSQLREGAVQVTTELQRLRSQAQRDSAGITLALIPANLNTYSLTQNGVTQVRTLPYNLKQTSYP